MTENNPKIIKKKTVNPDYVRNAGRDIIAISRIQVAIIIIGFIFYLIANNSDDYNDYKTLLKFEKTAIICISVLSIFILYRIYSAGLNLTKSVSEEIEQDAKEISISDENQNKIEIIQIKKLISLIDQEKNKGIFGKSKSKEIIELIEQISINYSTTMDLLNDYNRTKGIDLIKELISLSTNYQVIKSYLAKFINHGIIEENYPHQYK